MVMELFGGGGSMGGMGLSRQSTSTSNNAGSSASTLSVYNQEVAAVAGGPLAQDGRSLGIIGGAAIVGGGGNG